MNRSEKIEIRKKLEKILGSNSAIPNRDILLNSLKGYSPYTREVEEAIFSKHFSWMIIGKLAIDYSFFKSLDEGENKKTSKLIFFKCYDTYQIIQTQKDLQVFKDMGISTEGDLEMNDEDLTENIEIFFMNENNQKYSSDLELKEKLKNYFRAYNQNLLEKALKYRELMDYALSKKMLKGDVNSGLNLDSKGASLLYYRSDLYLEFSDDKAIVEMLTLINDASVNRAKQAKTKEEKRKNIMSGKEKR